MLIQFNQIKWIKHYQQTYDLNRDNVYISKRSRDIRKEMIKGYLKLLSK